MLLMPNTSDPVELPGPTCGKCGKPKHHTGSRWRCSPCYNAWQTAWKSQRTPEQKKVTQAVQTANRQKWTPEYRAREYARTQAWREANREQHRRVTRDWYQANIEYARKAKMDEYRRDPQAFMVRNLRRKARLSNAICGHGVDCVSADFLSALYASRCTYCTAPAEHADHFVPLARGGLHCVENLLPACGRCNSMKSHRDPAEWLASRTL